MDISSLLPLLLMNNGKSSDKNSSMTQMLMSMMGGGAPGEKTGDPMSAMLASMMKNQQAKPQKETKRPEKIGYGLAPIKDICPIEALHFLRGMLGKER